jgi:hypothetical protein
LLGRGNGREPCLVEGMAEHYSRKREGQRTFLGRGNDREPFLVEGRTENHSW